MNNALIAIDKWKLAIFTRHLEAAGHEFTEQPGLTPDTLMLLVETDSVAQLQEVVEAAQLECASQ